MAKRDPNLPPIGSVFVGRIALIREDTGDVSAFSFWANTIEELPVALAQAQAALASKGFRPMTSKEFRKVSEHLMDRESRKLAAEATADIMNSRAVDPEALDAMLKLHKGREGGDA
jgi:hypothetical protein